MENILDARQAVQSASLPELQERVRQCEAGKTKVLLELGQSAYDSYKNTSRTQLPGHVQQLIELNSMIYLSMEQAEKIKKANEANVCECGAHIQQSDQFCGSCGKLQKEEEQPVLVQCSQCQVDVPQKPYCACCGFAMGDVHAGGAV